MTIIPLKCCCTCKQFKPATSLYFANDRSTSDLLTRDCKECRNAHGRNVYVKKVPPTLPDGYKRCSVCKELKPATLEYFHSNPTIKDGLRSECKPCRKNQEARNYLNKEHFEPFKYCPVCKQVRPIEGFSRSKNRYDGRASRCKNCASRLHQKKVVVRDVPEGCKRCTGCKQVKPATTDYFHKQPGGFLGFKSRCRDCIAIRRKELRPFDKEYDQWAYKMYPDRILAKAHKRRTLKRGNGGSYTEQDIQDQLKRQRYHCYYCRAKFEKRNGKYIYHIEHIVPVARGGSSDMSNIVLACPTCNLHKHNRLPHEWPEGNRLL